MKRDKVAKRIICVCGLVFLMAVFPAKELPASDSKADVLRQRIGQILSLREKISKKQAQAIEIQENLKKQIKALREEIFDRCKSSRITSHEASKQSPRISYDLKLILQLRAYTSRLNEKMEIFASGDAKLEFLYLRADDDLKIIETLNHMAIEKLVTRIDKTIMEYDSINDEYLIDAKDMVLGEPGEIWNEIMQKN